VFWQLSAFDRYTLNEIRKDTEPEYTKMFRRNQELEWSFEWKCIDGKI